MSKFILIDQSIKGNGGHYLEYATNVLYAAKNAGYDPLIATNRMFNKKNTAFECLPIYSYDIWGDNGKTNRLKQIIKEKKASFRKKIDFERAKLKFTPLGYAYTAARQRDLTALTACSLWVMLIALFLIIPLYLALILKTLFSLFVFIIKPLKNKYTLGIMAWIKRLGAIILLPLVFIIKYNKKIKEGLHKVFWGRNFKKSTKTVIERFNVAQGDIIFIPTLSNIDFVALKKLIKKDDRANKCSWHIVFRRNLFVGREPVYNMQDPEMIAFRRATYECFAKSQLYKNLFFYTDTQKLTEQYSFMNTVTFHTLPIPINPKLQNRNYKDKKGPKTIVYLGDARREKGYQHLYKIVMELWDRYVETGIVDFDFQSNFSFKNMEANYDIVYARRQLSLLPSDKVKIRSEALDSEAYFELVANGDIGLLLYDKDNYYARSSGALVECLSAGMPVIVPSGSWLSENIDKDNYLYIRRLTENWEPILSKKGCEIEWMSAISEDVQPMQRGSLSFSTFEYRSFCCFPNIEKAGFILVTYYVNEILQKGNFVKTTITALDKYNLPCCEFQSDDYSTFMEGEKVHVLYKLPEKAKHVYIHMSNAFALNPISIDNLQVDFYAYEPNIPLGLYGLTYSRYEEIPYLLTNIIDNFSEFQKAARANSIPYCSRHNADALVNVLSKNGKGCIS